jgi:hypothetical protein
MRFPRVALSNGREQEPPVGLGTINGRIQQSGNSDYAGKSIDATILPGILLTSFDF